MSWLLVFILLGETRNAQVGPLQTFHTRTECDLALKKVGDLAWKNRLESKIDPRLGKIIGQVGRCLPVKDPPSWFWEESV